MKNTQIAFRPKDYSYHYLRKIDTAQHTNNYFLHNHIGYEIFIMLEGDITFFVEGSSYKLNPYDILVIRDGEMHQTKHLSQKNYQRIILSVKKRFFVEQNCTPYAKIFTDRKPGEENLIKAQYVKSSGILDAIERMERYIKETTRDNDAVIKGCLVEILHILNQLTLENDESTIKNDVVKNILAYINKNLSEPLTLDSIADYFFISKCHMCRIFKASTGVTINRYITNKRIMLVTQLCHEKKSIGAACIEAGFGSYSNFYKAYMKETGMSPRIGLKYID